MRYITNRRIFFGILFLIIVVLLRYSGIGEHINFGKLKFHRNTLKLFVEHNYWYSVLIYILSYMLIVTLFLPLAAVFTLAGGFLFGTLFGALFANIGATLGAIIAFLIVRYVIGDSLQKKYKQQLAKFNTAMAEQGSWYLLFVHFIFVIPFFMINILAGLTQVSLWTFTWTTSLGILPGAFVYTFTGEQLNEIDTFTDIFSGKVLLAFGLLTLMGIIPMVLKAFKKK